MNPRPLKERRASETAGNDRHRVEPATLNDFSRRVSSQLFGHILPFWCGPALDHERGGWLAWLSNDLKPDRTQPKGLIVNSRILWAFSAVHHARPDPLYRQMAESALDVVMNRFWDDRHGGAFWRLDDRGQVLDDSKKIYGQAFYVYALAKYHRAFHSPAALERALALVDLVEQHAHDAEHGGYLEVRRRDWSEADAAARLSDRDMNEKKSMNNHLHVLEAWTSLFRVRPEPRLAERLRELLDLFEQKIFNSDKGHFNHFFDERWQVKSDSYTFGHDIEGSWLLCEAAETIGDEILLARACHLALRLAEAVLAEGVGPEGALRYEGKDGRIIDDGRECWPQAEAVIGFLNAFQISGDEKFFNAALRVWNFIDEHLVDRVHGEWFWRILPDGQPDATLPKVSEWKGPYHGTRMCLETLRRLKELTAISG